MLDHVILTFIYVESLRQERDAETARQSNTRHLMDTMNSMAMDNVAINSAVTTSSCPM